MVSVDGVHARFAAERKEKERKRGWNGRISPPLGPSVREDTTRFSLESLFLPRRSSLYEYWHYFPSLILSLRNKQATSTSSNTSTITERVRLSSSWTGESTSAASSRRDMICRTTTSRSGSGACCRLVCSVPSSWRLRRGSWTTRKRDAARLGARCSGFSINFGRRF